MGRVTTPTFFVRMVVSRGSLTPEAWRTNLYGKPTEANLAKFVRELEASFEPGGANDHIQPMKVLSAQILRSADRCVVASMEATPAE